MSPEPICCLPKEEAAGKRLVLQEGKSAYQDIRDILNEDLPQLKGKISLGNPGSGKTLIKISPQSITQRQERNSAILSDPCMKLISTQLPKY